MSRILIVDDSLTQRQLLREFLIDQRHDIEMASDGVEAEALLAHDPAFDLVISDQEMPRMNGSDLLKWARSNPSTAQIPFLLRTAMGDLDPGLPALKAVIARERGIFQSKSARLDTFFEVVSNALAEHSQA